ncbi:MAG: PaaI family thioesterase [Sphingomonadaceae bacterium]|nr:PaaI family thioesterase [Sphingomonadaceae bacterium]
MQFNEVLRESHPDHPGWHEWHIADKTRFNQGVLGTLLVRPEDGNKARMRMFPTRLHTNISDNIHGGIILSLIDIALFAGSTVSTGRDMKSGVTVEVNNHFVGAGDPSRPLDAVVEVVRETGRMIFARGTVVQDDNVVSSFSGILRKIDRS